MAAQAVVLAFYSYPNLLAAFFFLGYAVADCRIAAKALPLARSAIH